MLIQRRKRCSGPLLRLSYQRRNIRLTLYFRLHIHPSSRADCISLTHYNARLGFRLAPRNYTLT